MRYYATLGGQKRTIDIEPADGSTFRLRIDEGDAFIVDAQWVESQTLSLLADGKSWEADLEDDGDAIRVLVAEELFSLELMDDRKLKLLAASGKHSVEGPVEVKSPMPGKLVKVLVTVGDEVAEGQGVAIVEAMKMENELKSPKAGRVTAINAGEGDTVEARRSLVVIV